MPARPGVKVLLTGGTGYLGSHTAVALVESGHAVVLYDNLSNSGASVVDRLEEITGLRLPFVKGDVRDTAMLMQTLAGHRIDAVIHFAGLKAVGESVENPIEYYANNVQGAISLLQAMRAAGVGSLVFSSSATVYGEPRYLPLDETHPTTPTNPYGRTKLQVEEILRDVVGSDAGWRIICLRYFNPVGAHASGLIGENPRGTPNNLMPFLAQVATGQQKQLKVFGGDYPTPDGTGIRDYIHAMDLAEGHSAALRYLENNLGWRAMNLGSGNGHSVLELVKAFELASGKPIPYTIVPRRHGDTANCYAKADMAARDLGWASRRNLDEMCASALRFQRNQAAVGE